MQLATKLCDEAFDGALRFDAQGELAYLLYDRGTPLVHLFSDSWPVDPVEHAWPTWAAKVGVTASVEERRMCLSAVSYRRELADFSFVVTSGSGSGDALVVESVLSAVTGRNHGHGTMMVIYTSAPIFRFLSWMMNGLVAFFDERDRSRRWKYLVG